MSKENKGDEKAGIFRGPFYRERIRGLKDTQTAKDDHFTLEPFF